MLEASEHASIKSLSANLSHHSVSNHIQENLLSPDFKVNSLVCTESFMRKSSQLLTPFPPLHMLFSPRIECTSFDKAIMEKLSGQANSIVGLVFPTGDCVVVQLHKRVLQIASRIPSPAARNNLLQDQVPPEPLYDK